MWRASPRKRTTQLSFIRRRTVGVATFIIAASIAAACAGTDTDRLLRPGDSVDAARRSYVPGAPVNVAATPGNSSATITWAAPASSGRSSIRSYIVRSNIGQTVTVDGKTLSATMTRLTNGRSYTFTVYASNSAGTGPASERSNSVVPGTSVEETPTAPAPSAPTSVTATAGDASATVNWTAPANAENANVTSYVVTSAPGNITVNVDAPATSASVGGLTNGTSYRFTVTAKSESATSPASSPSNAVTPKASAQTPTAPTAPTSVSATAGDARATVTWQAPSSTGSSAIESYTVSSTPGNISVVVAGTIKTATVAGLTNGTSYRFVVTAKNGTSTSPASAPSNAVTPQAPTAAAPPPGPSGDHETLQNPNPMGPLMSSTVVVPRGWEGRATEDIRPGGGCAGATACRTGEGANRFMCAFARMAFDDPIVYPGQPGKSHLHQFFGNTAIDANTNTSTIATKGNSTCSGGTANRTGYWTPAAIDANGHVVAPTTATIYYKSGYQMKPSLVQPMPTGLRMVAGDKNWSNVSQNQQRVWWTCTDRGPAYSSTIPDCGDRVLLIVIFPQCWDGKNLDSPDHKSHMAYPNYSNATNGSKCPSTHPVVLPEITEEFYWPVPRGAKSSTWHISSDMDMSKPGGLSAHADWMMGWDPEVMKTFVTQCLQLSKDCQVNGIGNNTYLNPPPM